MKKFKIALLFEQLILLIIKKFYLRKVMTLAEGKAKKQTRYLFKQLNLKTAEAGNPNINIILSRLLKNF